jgi:hypothetical protein
MATRKRNKPEPVAVETICSVCGLDWDAHGADPTTDDCIRLLKEELAAEIARKPIAVPIQVPVPVYPKRVPWYWGEWYGGYRPAPKYPYEITCKSGSQVEYNGTVVNEATPKLLTTSTSAL